MPVPDSAEKPRATRPRLSSAQVRSDCRRYKKCLQDILMQCSSAVIDLNAHGADTDDCEEYRRVRKIQERIWRTLPPNVPYGLNVNNPPGEFNAAG